MHERPSRKPRSKGKGRQTATKKRITTFGGVGSGAPTSREKLANYYYGSGYSCEQALFAALASELGMSLAKAIQAAPSAKGRGIECGGAFNAAVALLSLLYTVGDEQKAAIAEFKRLFTERYGSEECAAIQERQRRDCLEVIGETARMIDTIISRQGRE